MSLGILDDLADSLAPWRTADLGCIAVRKVATEQPLTADEFESTGPTSLAEREEAAKKAREEAARQERGRSSLALIQLIQAAIERRETLLRDLGEGAGTPAEQAGAAPAGAAAGTTPVGRLALEEFPDQALAREELAAIDLAAARVDMAELLPRNAFDPGYADTAAAHAQRSAASMGSFLSMGPGAGGDYSYDEAAAYYTDKRQEDEYSYSYYTDDEEKKAAAAEVRFEKAAAANAAANAAAIAKQPSGEDAYEYYSDEPDKRVGAGVGGVGAAGVGAAGGGGVAGGGAVAVGETAAASVASGGAAAIGGTSASALVSGGSAACTSVAAGGGGTSSAVPVGGAAGAVVGGDDEYEYYDDAAAPAALLPSQEAAKPKSPDGEYDYYEDDDEKDAYYGAYEGAAAGGSASRWGVWAEERAKKVAMQRSKYLGEHTAALSEPKSGEAEVSDEEFQRLCIRSLQEGMAATLTLVDNPPKAVNVTLSLSADGLRVLWTPPSDTPGFVRTTEIRSVVYAGADLAAPPFPDEAARPSHTRFSLVTPTGTVNFAIADAQKLQHVVCGLRHLARRPVERRAFLWQRAAAINRDKIAAASFEKRLDGLTAFLLKERSALP